MEKRFRIVKRVLILVSILVLSGRGCQKKTQFERIIWDKQILHGVPLRRSR
jgi:hypothetical protein